MPKAYIIGGHGSNGDADDTFIVPHGCTIIARIPTGELSYTLKRDLDILCDLDNDIIENPARHKKKLIQQYGSLAIYEAGSHCPNFIYTLVNCFDNGRLNKYGTCYDSFSGVVDVKEYKKGMSCSTDMTNIDTFRSELYLSELYKYSVFPTKSAIDGLESVLGVSDYHDIMIDKLNNLLTISQRELCRDFPGVYYNFVCRVVSPRMSNKKLLGAKIHESELFRKPVLRNYYRRDSYEANTSKYSESIREYDEIIARVQKDIENKESRGENTTEDVEDMDYMINKKNAMIKLNAAERLRRKRINAAQPNTSKRMHNAYTAKNGSYIKIKGKWVKRTKKTATMKHTSPKRSSRKSSQH